METTLDLNSRDDISAILLGLLHPYAQESLRQWQKLL